MALVERIVQALEALGGVAQYSELYAYLEKNALGELPPNWKASVRARIEEHSSDSQAFAKRQDIFYAVHGLGNGVWGLRSKLMESPVAVDIDEPEDIKQISDGNLKPKRKKVQVTRIIRDTTVTRQIKAIYQYRCQICDNSIALYDRLYAEAHHLRPLGGFHNGLDTPGNILIVCPNHHVEFDFGAVAIDPLEKTIVHTDLHYPFIGKTVLFHPLHKIDELNLTYHMEIYLQSLNLK